MKTIQDRLKELIKESRAVAKRNIAASVRAEEYGDLEQLLGSVIEEIDYKQRSSSEANEAMLASEQALRDVAIKLTSNVMSCLSSPSESPEPKKRKQML